MKLAYKQLSDGPPLVIIHGLYGSSDNWYSIGKALRYQFGVYLIDQRNHGHSPHHPEHTYQQMQEDLLEFADRHNLYRLYLLGHSMGGKTALHFAYHQPDRMAGLVVADISPFGYEGTETTGQLEMHEKILKALIDLKPERLNNRQEASDRLAESIPSSRVRQFLLKNLHLNRNKQYEWKLNPQILLDNLPNILQGLPRPGQEGFRKLTGYPILFLRGGESAYIGDATTEAIRELAPFSELVTLKGAGHWLHAEQPEAFLEAIKDTFVE